jgi:hypothetical protein
MMSVKIRGGVAVGRRRGHAVDVAGGSVHGVWPEHGVGFSYVMSLMRDDQDVDPRPQALLQALCDATR